MDLTAVAEATGRRDNNKNLFKKPKSQQRPALFPPSRRRSCAEDGNEKREKEWVKGICGTVAASAPG